MKGTDLGKETERRFMPHKSPDESPERAFRTDERSNEIFIVRVDRKGKTRKRTRDLHLKSTKRSVKVCSQVDLKTSGVRWLSQLLPVGVGEG